MTEMPLRGRSLTRKSFLRWRKGDGKLWDLALGLKPQELNGIFIVRMLYLGSGLTYTPSTHMMPKLDVIVFI